MPFGHIERTRQVGGAVMSSRSLNVDPLGWPACSKCGSTADLHRHHLVPVAQGGSDDRRNLIWLCSGCHRSWHARSRHLSREALPRTFVRWISDRRRPVPMTSPAREWGEMSMERGRICATCRHNTTLPRRPGSTCRAMVSFCGTEPGAGFFCSQWELAEKRRPERTRR